MTDPEPRRLPSRLRALVPLVILALVLAGTTAAFASGAFETDDSGFDSAVAGGGGGGGAGSETATFVDLPDGTVDTFSAGVAGSVTVRRDGASLSFVSVSPAAGWRADIEQPVGGEIEVNLQNGTDRVDVNLELEDGLVRVRVRTTAAVAAPAPAPAPAPVPAPTPAPAPAPAPPVVTLPSDDHSGPGHGGDDSGGGDSSGPGSIDDRTGAPDDHSGPGHGGDDSGGDDSGGHSGRG